MIATQKIEVTKTSQSRLNEVNWEDLGFGKIFSDHMAVIEYRDRAFLDYAITIIDDPMEPAIQQPATP